MRQKKLPNIHPGEILNEEFLIPMKISMYRLAKDINVPAIRISEIVKGRRAITVDTAIRLSKFFGTSAEVWLGLQSHYDIEEARDQREEIGKEIKRYTSVSIPKEKTIRASSKAIAKHSSQKIALHR